jgi:RNA polymerase sigma factor for flagellar operon FliA
MAQKPYPISQPERADYANDLWAEYHKTRSKESRNKLIEYYLPYVKSIALKILERLPRHALELDDLINAGIFGLVDAIERFDPNLGTKFSVYSYNKINGAILDALRKLDCISYVGRNLAYTVEQAYDNLYREMGREPTIADIAKRTNLKPDEVEEGLQLLSRINLSGKKSFHVKDSNDNYIELTELVEDKEVNIDRVLLCESLKKYIKENFSAFEQLIFTLYFESNLTLTQIAKMFEYSPSRISDIFNQLLLRLRTHLRLVLEKQILKK